MAVTHHKRDTTLEPKTEEYSQIRPPRRSLSFALVALSVLVAVAWISSQSFGGVPKAGGWRDRLTTIADTPHHTTKGHHQANPSLVATSSREQRYALTPECVTNDTDTRSCTYHLWRTGDGQKWTGYPTPLSRAENPRLASVGERGVLIENGEHRWFSSDAGNSWTEHTNQPIASVASLPPTAIVATRCANRTCAASTVVATMSDGTLVRLARSPGLGRPTSNEWMHQVNGAIWLTGRAESGRPTISISTTGGRSWYTTILPASGTGTQQIYAATQDGRRGYVVVGSDGASTGTTVFATGDAGFSWNDMSRRGDAPSNPDGVALTQNGHLLLSAANTVYGSNNGGSSFRAVDPAPALSHLRVDSAGYLGGDEGDDYYFSPDGVEWQRLDLNAVSA